MGSGTWSASTYDRVTGSKMRRGATFSYTDDVKSRGWGDYKAHESLDPLRDGKPTIREARDSAEHPESTPIAIPFDVTGSMGDNPAKLQVALKPLFGMLVRRDVCPDPQISVMAYGDAYCDFVPLQVGQFESDNRIDDELDNVFIEQGGGGNDGETATLAAQYLNDHVVTDAWEKRRKKGYVFFVGDERALDLKPSQVTEFIGDKQPAGSLSAEAVFKRLQEKWNVYFLLIDNLAARDQESYEQYSSLLGPEHVIKIHSGEEAPAVIVAIIGAMEETADSKTLGTELVEAGFDAKVAENAVALTSDLYKGGSEAIIPVDDSYGELDLG